MAGKLFESMVWAGGDPYFYARRPASPLLEAVPAAAPAPNRMAEHFGLLVPEGGPIKATSFVAQEAEAQRASGGDWRDFLDDLWRAGRDAVIGVLGDKARQSKAGQEYEQKQTQQKLGELLMGPVGLLGGLLLLLLLARR